MEHPSADEHESFFCPECRGFKLLRTFRPVFAAAADHRRGHHRSGHRFGRLHRAATGDRWLLPD
ncbi:MAG: hypothetical protein INR65_11475 [Gluconacetobacter diazotrophicus]|nr:hypothetical protein [Gluconacetobacter diazotrophicus]